MDSRRNINSINVIYPRRKLGMRSVRVLFFFGRALMSTLFWDIFLRRIGFRKYAQRTAVGRYRDIAQEYRRLAIRLGGVWIKVGQFLSSRIDVLPEAITTELSGLQDEVPSESIEAMMSVIRQEFGPSWETRFPRLDPEPLASASLGQVHRARLEGGETVVVKIQRPGIQELIRVDLASLARVIGWLKHYRPVSRRVNLDALLDEFSRTLWEEVDYLAEAKNAIRFQVMFEDDPQVRIPLVYEAYTTKYVLTLEDVYFIKITDYAAIEASGVDRAEVADRLFHTYLKQIFEEGIFHADPHPGNLFVEPLEEGAWRLIFVDFGMIGRVNESTREGLRDLAIAVGTQDLERLMRAYQELNILLPSADLERIKQAEAMVFDRFWGKSMRELTQIDHREMRAFAREYRDLLYEMPFQIPGDIIFLGRCVAILSGMCTGLYEDFNLFEGLRPFADKLLAEEDGAWLDLLLEQLGEQARALSRLPKRLDATLALIERGQLKVIADVTPELEAQLKGLTTSINRLVWVFLFGVLFLAGTFFYARDFEVFAMIVYALSVIVLARIVFL